MSAPVSIVHDRNGQPGTLESLPSDLSAPGAHVSVLLSDGRRLRVPVALLASGEGGAFTLDLSFEEVGGGSTQVMREIEERLDVHVDVVETGRVRATRRVESREETVDVPTWRETVQIEHIEINEYVNEVQPIRQEGGVTIVPVYEEVLVVEKRLLLKEEVRFTLQRQETHDPQTVMLRRSNVEVERFSPPPTPAD